MSFRHLTMLLPFLLGLAPTTDAFATLDTDPYAWDTSFYAGAALEDRFAGSSSAEYRARKVVRLDSGEIVVAGLVPQFQTPNTGDGLYHIGLVRYGSGGERLAWANPPAGAGHFNNTYLVLPVAPAIGRYSAIRDIRIVAGYIYLLVDLNFDTDDRDVLIFALRGDGSLVGTFAPFATGLDETAAGLAVYSIPGCHGLLPCSKIIAVATYTTGGGRQVVTTRRFDIGTNGPPAFTPDGTLVVDTSFGPNGNGAIDFTAPDIYCGAGTACSVHANGVAVARADTASPTVYIGAQLRYADLDTDTGVLAIDGGSGNVAAFGSNGFARVVLDAGGSNTETVMDVAVSTGTGGDQVYVVADVSLPCAISHGVGVVRFDANGVSTADLVTGGDTDPACGTFATRTLPSAIALGGDRSLGTERLLIVGTEGFVNPAVGVAMNPLLAALRTSTMSISEWLAAAPPHAAGATYTGGAWTHVFALAGDRLLTTGELLDSLGSLPLFATARFAPDRIFGDGLDAP